MKKIIIGIVLAALFFLGCEKPSNPVGICENPGDLPGYPDKVLLSGQVVEIQYGYNGYEKIVPVANVEVEASALDNKDTTDIDGNFQLVLPRADSVHLQIEKPLYLSFKQTVFFETDTSAVFEIDPIRADFFPLAVGNTWNYDYYRYYVSNSCIYHEREFGTQSWEVVEETQDGEYTNYRVLVIHDGVFHKIWYDVYTNIPDTTTVQIESDSSYFVVAESEDNFLDINYHNCNEYWEGEVGTFKRYQPLTIGDTLIISSGLSRLVREKGFVYFANGGMHSGIRMNLLDYHIVPEE